MRRFLMFALFATIIPVLSFAAGTDKVTGLLNKILDWIGLLGKIVMAATVVAFFYGLFQFVFNEGKREEGKTIMVWGIVALAVMSSIWGLVSVLTDTVGVTTTDKITMPKIPGVDY